ncbi:MAG: diphthamide synthesis protein, partial [Candidatus Diapherotrites archaeon]
MVELCIDEKKIYEIIKKYKPKKVLVQAPAGLKRKIVTILQDIENKTKTEFIISADTCFGACDIPLGAIEVIKPDITIHIGHLKMVNIGKIFYLPAKYEFTQDEKKDILNILLDKLKSEHISKIVGTASVQYLDLLYWLVFEAKKNNVDITIKKGVCGKKGLILGCNVNAAMNKSKIVLFIGDGEFHAVGIAKSLNKEVLLLDPLSKKISWLKFDSKKFAKKRNVLMLKVRSAKNFGLVFSTK